MKAYDARDRAVIAMEGSDVAVLLQNTVSNDIAKEGAVYAALLTPQGKYLFDFFLIEQDGRWLIDVAAERAEALTKRLAMYCLRRDARVTGAAGLAVTLVWGCETLPDVTDGLACPDPRDPRLGWRLYAPDETETAAKLGAEPATRADYDALRVAALVPETGIELVPDETYILEAGFERLNGVDFKKGCYVGQEVTARMKHKTTLRKGLVQVEIDGSAEPGTPITAAGKPAGTLFTQAGGRALAHLRLDRANGELQAGGARLRYQG